MKKRTYQNIFEELKRNRKIFKVLLNNIHKEEYLWRQAPDKWCLLEIVCHLHDEEIEDFRTRVKYVLEDPAKELPPINPTVWVSERKYTDQNFDLKFKAFIKERKESIGWLKSLDDPQWENYYNHPKLGPMSAKLFLSNWLAHDLLHIRQILKLRFEYLKYISSEDLSYAGNW